MRWKKWTYGLLALSGFVGGMYCLYLYRVSLDYAGFFNGIVTVVFSHPLAAGITLDALIVGVAFLIWMVPEARALSMRHWWAYIVLFFTTPLAFVVPLFLMMRETKLEALVAAEWNGSAG